MSVSPVPGSAPRRAAVQMLHDVLVLGHPLDDRVQQHLRGLGASDRGLARALVGAVLRHLPALDRLMDSACRRPLPADARARQVLRVALAGSLVLDTPDHAVVATALPLVSGGPRRLVHGVLGTLLRRRPQLPAPVLPAHWAARWQASWGPAEVAAATRQFAAVPPTDLTLADPGRTADWAAALGGTSLLPGQVRLAGSQRVEELAGYADGGWWVQDLAASLPVRICGEVRGRRVLDVGAAPGGKTMQLLAAGAQVTALDVSAARLARLQANLARTGFAAELVAADALHWTPPQPFDCIVLDAPCSASGTYRRHPELLQLKTADGIAALAELQTQMLARAAGWLVPGGTLVYAVCSLERAEGEDIAPPPALTPAPIEVPLPPAIPVAGHIIRTLPSTLADAGGVDGFFIARYRRR